MPSPLHVALRCDGGRTIGVGHVIRCLALGDELLSRGVEVTLVGAVTDVPWVQEQVAQRAADQGLRVVSPPVDDLELPAMALQLGFDAVVLDGYHLDRRVGRSLRSAAVVVLAVVDGPFGADQEADLYLDQNLGAEPPRGPWVPPDANTLLGLDHVLFRDQILRHRRSEIPPPSSPPRVLCVFGGTDAYSAGPVVVPLLLRTGRPVHVVVIAAKPELGASVAGLPTAPGQVVEVLAPTPDLARLAVTCDAAVIAAGTSVWEFLCLGVPTGLLCVTANQRVGYDAVVAEGVTVPVGHLDTLREDAGAEADAVAALRRLVDDAEHRNVLAGSGRRLIDGRGRARVVDALLGRCARYAAAPGRGGIPDTL